MANDRNDRNFEFEISRHDFQAERSGILRGPTSTNMFGGQFNGTTTNKTDYDQKQVRHIFSIIEMQEILPFQFQAERNGIIRGAADAQLFSGPFNGQTTNKSDYDQKQVEIS